ncbi:MAG: tRNA pseudouridine(55) synthase TruB [Solobacterium sp.]|nr:tRNA pseudouridine(55) synthase TruB [Solobacterium sp.]
MDAVILLNKPAGMTSFDAVRKCRRIFSEKKAGHTGTLDPEASGLMIILLGKYTKYLPFCVKDHKQYHAEFLLGKKTDTEDVWGTVTEEKPYGMHEQRELDEISEQMTGKIMQVPPMYSAIKKDGRKLYEYARRGITIEREAREITVFSLQTSHIEDNRYAMDASVSSGTYIRTLITDYAAKMNELAAMSSLVRTGIEHITLADSCTFEDLENGRGLADPAVVLDRSFDFLETDDPAAVRNGRKLKIDHPNPHLFLTENGLILAAYERQEDGLYHCMRGLL